jgi:3-oxoacyl-[acyl-carrier-protein] synthase II
MEPFQTQIGGEVTPGVLPSIEYRRPNEHREPALDHALAAASEALKALPKGLVSPERMGVVLGTCNAGLLSAREWLRQDDAGEPQEARLVGLVTPGCLADELAAAFDFRGPVLAVNTACASGANAIGIAFDLVREGRADAVLAGGTDALSDVVFAGFSALESLAPTPAAPYSAQRQGLSLGEGSGMVVLMDAQQAERAALPILAEVAGYGLSADGYHATAPRPDGSGAAKAITAAMRTSGVQPSDVGYINGHGTGTLKNDSAESSAIRLALGESAAANVLVSSTKSVVGHLLGAAGAVEAIVTVGALHHQVAPPTAGYLERDPDCALDYVPGEPRELNTDVALSNNFAFGGANACLVLTRPRALAPPPEPPTDEVVITGVGLVNPAGEGVDAVWDTFLGGHQPHHGHYGVRQFAVDVDPEPFLSRRDRRRMDRLSVLSVVTAAKALVAAGVTPHTGVAAGCGVIFGTGAGPMEAMERFIRPLLADSRAAADPGVFPNTVYNQAAGQVAMHLGLYGPTSTLSTGHASAGAALGYATGLLRRNHARMLLVTVTDVLTAQVVRGYAANDLVSGGCDPEVADGRFTLSEGSVSVVVERRSSAAARGAPVLGRIIGYGLASDGSRVGGHRARVDAVERGVRAALADGSSSPRDVGDVWLSAAGLASADRAEDVALSRVFGTGETAPSRHAPKRVLGEPVGTGAALSLALAIRRWHDYLALPALINSSSLTGGHNSLLIAPATTRSHEGLE